MAGIDMAPFAASESGRMLFSVLQASYPRLALLSQIKGFDPLRDARETLLAATGEPNANQTLVLLRGTFDPGKLKANGADVRDHGGIAVLQGDETKGPWLAILNGTTAVLGAPENVQRLMERGAGGGSPPAELRGKAQRISDQFDFWAVSEAPAAKMAEQLPDGQLSGILRGDVMAAVLETNAGVKFGRQILLSMQALTATAKDAATLAEVLRFFVGVSQLTDRRNPKSAPTTSLLDRMNLTTEGNRMSVTLVLNDADLQRLIRRALDLGLVGGR